VEVSTKNILYPFMKGQTHFSTSWHAKMSMTLHTCTKNVSKQPTPYQKS
jgi:hypothetical protein